MDITIPDLVAKLEAFPVQSANRPLMAEEIVLRTTWINLIYMMLENLDETDNVTVENSTVDTTIRQKYDEYAQFISDWRKQQNYEDRDAAAMVTELKVDDVMKGCTSTAESLSDPMEKAMLPQNLRVALLTLVVIEEEKRCFDDDGGNLEPMPPQPPIPGTK